MTPPTDEVARLVERVVRWNGARDPKGYRVTVPLAELRAAIAEMDRLSRPVGDWRPINTAPRDHEAYLFVTKRGAIRVDSFHRTQVSDSKHRWQEAPIDPYTHWMPLPTPPASPAPGGDA